MTGRKKNKLHIVPTRDILNIKEIMAENSTIQLLASEFTTQDLIIAW